jgi:hypothetical protein
MFVSLHQQQQQAAGSRSHACCAGWLQGCNVLPGVCVFVDASRTMTACERFAHAKGITRNSFLCVCQLHSNIMFDTLDRAAATRDGCAAAGGPPHAKRGLGTAGIRGA